MTSDTEKLWNQRYQDGANTPKPAEVLLWHRHLLPRQGRALDIACGLGNNALLLAETGLDTSAWDISTVAISKLNALAAEHRLPLRAAVRDVEKQPPEPDHYDVITVSRFLLRGLETHLHAALRPGGLIFYQTFTKLKVSDTGPGNPDFLLDDNELLNMFRPLKIRIYREEHDLGDCAKGFRNSAMLIAQKPL